MCRWYLIQRSQTDHAQSEQASTLKVLHLGHYAIDKMKMNLGARETVYWPEISEDITVTYHRCDICAKFARTPTVSKSSVKLFTLNSGIQWWIQDFP